MRMLTLRSSSMRHMSNFTPMDLPVTFAADCALVYELHQRYVFSVDCVRYFMLLELERMESQDVYSSFQYMAAMIHEMRLYNLKKGPIPEFISRREEFFQTLESRRLTLSMTVAREVDVWISNEMFPAAQPLSVDDG